MPRRKRQKRFSRTLNKSTNENFEIFYTLDGHGSLIESKNCDRI